jgi:hypothetical protein
MFFNDVVLALIFLSSPSPSGYSRSCPWRHLAECLHEGSGTRSRFCPTKSSQQLTRTSAYNCVRAWGTNRPCGARICTWREVHVPTYRCVTQALRQLTTWICTSNCLSNTTFYRDQDMRTSGQWPASELCGGKTGTRDVFLTALKFSHVSIIPPLLHTHSFIYQTRCIMFFSQYFSIPLSVSFHHCSILIHSSTTHPV